MKKIKSWRSEIYPGSCVSDYVQFGRDILFITSHRSIRYSYVATAQITILQLIKCVVAETFIFRDADRNLNSANAKFAPQKSTPNYQLFKQSSMKPICLGKCLQTPLIIGIYIAHEKYNAHYQRKKQEWAMITDEARIIVGNKIVLQEKYVLQDNDKLVCSCSNPYIVCTTKLALPWKEQFRYISAVFLHLCNIFKLLTRL